MAKLSAAELGNISKINLRGSSSGIKSAKGMNCLTLLLQQAYVRAGSVLYSEAASPGILNAGQKERETRALSEGLRQAYDNLKSALPEGFSFPFYSLTLYILPV